ncbi:MAG: hypothetical protein ACXVAO_09680 [Vulcanimicrobiaceae bacterium]
MLTSRYGRLFGVFVTLVALSACGGHGLGGSVVPSPHAPSTQGQLVGATFVFEIPRSLSSGKVRKPAYIPASVQSFKLTLNTVNGGAPPSGLNPLVVNVTNTTNGCAPDGAHPGNTKCTVTYSIPPGSDALTIQAFDASNAGGNLLSQQNYTANVVTGQTNTFSTITLDANPGAITVSPPGTGVSGSVGSGFSIHGTSAVAFTLSMNDTHGTPVGTQPGVPTFSATSANPSVAAVSVTGNTLTVTPGSTFNTPAQITVKANPASGGDGLSATQVSFNVTIVQTLIAVGGCNTDPTCQINIYTYNAGAFNEVAAIAGSLGLHQVTYLRFDSANTLYDGDANSAAYAVLKFPYVGPASYFGAPTVITDAINSSTISNFGFDVGGGGAMVVENAAAANAIVGYPAGASNHSVAYSAPPTGGSNWIGATEYAVPTAAVLTNTGGTVFGYATILKDTNAVANDKIAVLFTGGSETEITAGVTSANGDIIAPAIAWDSADQDLVFANSGPGPFNIVRYHWNGSSFDSGTVAASVTGNPYYLAVSRDGHIAVEYYCGGSPCVSVFAHGNTAPVWPWNNVTVGDQGPAPVHFFPDNSLLVIAANSVLNFEDICVYSLSSTTAAGCTTAAGPSFWQLSDGAISN